MLMSMLLLVLIFIRCWSFSTSIVSQFLGLAGVESYLHQSVYYPGLCIHMFHKYACMHSRAHRYKVRTDIRTCIYGCPPWCSTWCRLVYVTQKTYTTAAMLVNAGKNMDPVLLSLSHRPHFLKQCSLSMSFSQEDGFEVPEPKIRKPARSSETLNPKPLNPIINPKP